MIKVVPNWVIALLAAIVFSVTFGYGHHVGYESSELDHSKQVIVSLEEAAKREKILRDQLQAERDRLSTVSGKLQEQLAMNEGAGNVSSKNIIKEVEKPVYRDSRLPSSGVQVLSESAREFNSVRSPKDRQVDAGAVPAPARK